MISLFSQPVILETQCKKHGSIWNREEVIKNICRQAMLGGRQITLGVGNKGPRIRSWEAYFKFFYLQTKQFLKFKTKRKNLMKPGRWLTGDKIQKTFFLKSANKMNAHFWLEHINVNFFLTYTKAKMHFSYINIHLPSN